MSLISAASILTYFNDGPECRFLMGCRSQQHKFMPGVYVFPGGKVDAQDEVTGGHGLSIAYLPGSELDNLDCSIDAFASAALRELEEETGYSYKALVSDLQSNLTVMARAITPPYPGPRYDTLFFLLEAEQPESLGMNPNSAELECLGWYSLDETKGFPIAGITRCIQQQGLNVAKNGFEIPFWAQLEGGI